jgi:PQQ-dependent dehydrogenase (s-GDH family)
VNSSRRMMIVVVVAFAVIGLGATQQAPVVAAGPERFDMRVVVAGLHHPWEVRFAPDGRLWVTERSGRRIVRIDPVTSVTATAVEIPDAYQVDSQDGVLGLALDPSAARGQVASVFVSLTYDADPGPAVTLRMKVRRYRYDAASGHLVDPADLLADLPAGDDHVGGRLALGADRKLYLTIGDSAANHLWNACTQNRAQDLPTSAEVRSGRHDTYRGKILRLNLDGSIPVDNPVLAGVRSHIYSYGHRNPQGLAFGPNGALYSAEHGPNTDDELNLIRAGKNYGWPFVAGYRDDRSYAYGNWSKSSPVPCVSLRFDPIVNPPSVPVVKETEWNSPDFAPPLRTFFTVDSGYPFDKLGHAAIAPSGIEVYSVPRGGIPGWSNSVLITSLLKGSIYRVKLAPDGSAIEGEPLEYFKTANRYRDVAVSPDGQTIFVAVDSSGSQANPGAILAFTIKKAAAR